MLSFHRCDDIQNASDAQGPLRAGIRRRRSTLLITCMDMAVNRAISRLLLGDGSVTVIRRLCRHRTYQALCDSPWVHSIVPWVNSRRITDVVICGHTMCSRLASANKLIDASAGAGQGCSILQRTRQRELLNQQVKREVIRQVDRWFQLAGLRQSITCGALRIHGLFYLAESGVFMLLDRTTGQFSAISLG